MVRVLSLGLEGFECFEGFRVLRVLRVLIGVGVSFSP